MTNVTSWLLLCLFLLALMVAVGGWTRLTGSGLSIVEWKPAHGILPPLTAQEWEEEFAAYRQTPQYVKINAGMTLQEFKGIFWLEYLHRLLGRLIGAVLLLPLIYFYSTRRIGTRLALKLLAIFSLGGLQGVMGWYMVKSGLVADPKVSPLRLALHLGLGFLIFGLIFWQWLHLRGEGPHPTPLPKREGISSGLRLGAWLVTCLVFVQVLSGALMAGNHAGLIYNSFPLMDGHWVPDGFWPSPGQVVFEHIPLIHFTHRLLAYSVLAGMTILWCAGRNSVINSRLHVVLALACLQALLGVMTLLMGVPLALASLHQLGALGLFAALLWLCHGMPGKRKHDGSNEEL